MQPRPRPVATPAPAVRVVAAFVMGMSGAAAHGQALEDDPLYFEIDVVAPVDAATALDHSEAGAEAAAAVGSRAEVSGIAAAGRSVVGTGQLQRDYAGASLDTVLKDIAGIDTESAAGDPNIAVSVRGLADDGRVAVTIDGARQNFARSGHSIGSSFTVDPETLRSVAVVRGPAGTDAGAGAYAGTVALRTLEATDLIAPDASRGGVVRLRYGTNSEEPTGHLALATLLGTGTDLLLAVTRKNTADYTAPDGTEVTAAEETLSVLAKVAHEFGGGERLTFTLASNGSDYETGQVGVPRENRLDALNATLNFTLPASGGRPALDATLYRTDTRVAQRRLDADGTPIGNERSYRTLTMGLRAEVATTAATGRFDHDLKLVLDGFRDEVTVDDPDAANGSLTAPGTRKMLSLIAEDVVTLTPRTQAVVGLRYDNYSLDSDDGSSSGAQWSPSLTLRHSLGPLTLHASAARAFRPPTLSEALVNGEHPEPANFLILPNPDLSPERATTYEIGATLRLDNVLVAEDRFDARMTLYQSEVTDYIGLVEKGTLFNAYRQYENIDRARIRGGELELSYDAGFAFGRVSGQFAQGTDLEDGSDLSGVGPDGYVLTAGWRPGDRSFEIGGRYTHTMAREDGTLSSEDWDRYDIFMTKEFGEGAQFSLTLNNITDETYTPYRSTLPARGFNALASLSLKF